MSANNQLMIKRTFFTKQKYSFILFLLIGFICSVTTRNFLALSQYQSGAETICLFIPPFLCVINIYISGYNNRFGLKNIILSLLLFLILNIPFRNSLFNEVKPNPGDDFEYCFKYAQNMITNKTLWGGDQIRFPNESKSYITQPGYRYFVALELLIFQKLYRFVSILNISIFITAVFFLFKTIHSVTISRKMKFMFSFLIIFSIPYATKNILMGLPEWLAITLLMFFTYFYFLKNKPIAAFIILAFIPFLRQNLLPPVLVFLFFHFITQKFDYKIIIAFVIIIMLPVYHNLYYANELRYFTSVFEWPFFDYKSTGIQRVKIFHFINNLMHYTGFDFNNSRIDFIEEGFLMLIAFVIIYINLGKQIESALLKICFYIVTLFALIIPTLLMATDYYPRFEFVVIYFTIVIFLHFKTTHTTVHLLCE